MELKRKIPFTNMNAEQVFHAIENLTTKTIRGEGEGESG